MSSIILYSKVMYIFWDSEHVIMICTHMHDLMQVKSSLTRSAFVELSMSKKCILPSLHTSEDLPFNKRPMSNLSYESYKIRIPLVSL